MIHEGHEVHQIFPSCHFVNFVDPFFTYEPI